MEDISAVSQMDFDALSAQQDEEHEEALSEIVEFLWVAAMLIRDNLVETSPSQEIEHEYH